MCLRAWGLFWLQCSNVLLWIVIELWWQYCFLNAIMMSAENHVILSIFYCFSVYCLQNVVAFLNMQVYVTRCLCDLFVSIYCLIYPCSLCKEIKRLKTHELRFLIFGFSNVLLRLILLCDVSARRTVPTSFVQSLF